MRVLNVKCLSNSVELQEMTTLLKLIIKALEEETRLLEKNK